MLTLAPDLLAHEGMTFTFIGPNTGGECDGCPVQKLCFDLQPETRYKVTELRDVVHPCNLHEGGMRVVTVEPTGFETTLDTKRLRGTAATFVPVDCGMPECTNWKLCHPVGPKRNVRYQVTSVGDAVDCPMNYNIKRVQLDPLS